MGGTYLQTSSCTWQLNNKNSQCDRVPHTYRVHGLFYGATTDNQLGGILHSAQADDRGAACFGPPGICDEQRFTKFRYRKLLI